MDERFSPKVKELIDEEKIGLANAFVLADVPIGEQDQFIFEAMNFTTRSLKTVVRRWTRCVDKEVIGQILSDVNEAFNNWASWEGNIPDADEMDEFRENVESARGRVLAFVHGLTVTVPGKVI